MRLILLEVRDRGTFIPVFAMNVTPENAEQRFLLRRSGYSDDPLIIMGSLRGGEATYDPYRWGTGARTMHVAHKYITEHFEELRDGDVVCVEHILGERDAPKISERLSP